jgi:hypothetical protein
MPRDSDSEYRSAPSPTALDPSLDITIQVIVQTLKLPGSRVRSLSETVTVTARTPGDASPSDGTEAQPGWQRQTRSHGLRGTRDH